MSPYNHPTGHDGLADKAAPLTQPASAQRGRMRPGVPAHPKAPAPHRVTVSDHQPVLPIWTCLACDDEWPCHTRRQQLLAEHDGDLDGLVGYLASVYARALVDLDAVAVLVGQGRFVGWLGEQVETAPTSAADGQGELRRTA